MSGLTVITAALEGGDGAARDEQWFDRALARASRKPASSAVSSAYIAARESVSDSPSLAKYEFPPVRTGHKRTGPGQTRP
jgi:hypothetical protein